MKKLVLVALAALAFPLAAAASEKIFLNPDGSVIDPDCKYRIADLLDARDKGTIAGGALSNHFVNAHTDACNAQRSKAWQTRDQQLQNWNATTDAIDSAAARAHEAEMRQRESDARVRQTNSWSRSNDAWSNYLNRSRR